MSPFSSLFLAAWRNWWAMIRHASRADRWRGLLFFSLLGAFMIAAEYLSFRLFSAFLSVGEMGLELVALMLVLRLLAMVFVIVLGLLFFGAMIAAIDTFFFDDDLDFLASHPIPTATILARKLASAWLTSAWVVFLVVTPFMAGYGRALGHGYAHLPLSLLALVLYTIPPVAAASLVVIFLMRIMPVNRAREAVLVAGGVVSCAVILLYRLLSPARLFRPDLMLADFQRFVQETALPLGEHSPPQLMAQTLIAATRLDWTGYGGQALALSGWALVALAIFFFAGIRLYRTDRPVSASAATPGWLERLSGVEPFSRLVARFFPPGCREIIRKEILINWREPMQISHVFLVGGIVILHFCNLSEVPYDLHPAARTLVAFLNLALVGLVAAAVAVRFIYPSVAIEGKPFWRMLAAPLTARRFVAVKFAAGWLPLTFAALVTVAVSNALIGVTGALFWLWLAATAAMTTAITALGVALGLALPALDRRNVFEISSAPGGIIFMLASLLYVGFVIMLLARPTAAAAFGQSLRFLLQGGGAFAVIALVSAGLTFCCWRWAERAYVNFGEVES